MNVASHRDRGRLNRLDLEFGLSPARIPRLRTIFRIEQKVEVVSDRISMVDSQGIAELQQNNVLTKAVASTIKLDESPANRYRRQLGSGPTAFEVNH